MRDLHNVVLFGVAQIHAAEVFDRPEQVALGQRAAIKSVAGKDRDGGIAGVLHALERLPQREVLVKIGTVCLRGEKEKKIQNNTPLSLKSSDIRGSSADLIIA